ncbi:MAG: autotransporter assembly complex protein TamA [Maritimibacter sp.]
MMSNFLSKWVFPAVVATGVAASPAMALESLRFDVRADDALAKKVEQASLLAQAKKDGRTDARDLFATAQADYARLLKALYAEGHYGAVIRILIDGREAGSISNFAVPNRISDITVQVAPGDKFLFGRTAISPLVTGTSALPEFARGEVARSTAIQEAVDQAVSDWRDAGHAKVDVADQDLSANHRSKELNALVFMAPGPRVRLGVLNQTTPSAVRAARIQAIAGLPTGEVFSPKKIEDAADRLRKTGAFSSVAMSEGDVLRSGNVMDVDLALVDMTPRRFGFGAEVSSLDGLTVSGFWLHRNLLGGAERFRVEAEVGGVTPALDGIDTRLSARLDVPAAFGTRTSAFAYAHGEWLHEPGYEALQAGAEVGIGRVFSDKLSGEIGLGYLYSRTTDSQGTRSFSLLQAPVSGVWDGRDNRLDPTKGFYVDAEIEPYIDLGNGPGVWSKIDARGYYGFGERITVAGRIQAGRAFGQPAANTHPEYLFYSGGGGTVRGHPYQSLSIDAGGGDTIGGRAFLGLSGEVRYKINDSFGAVAFVDGGWLGAENFFDAGSGSHIGAGLGVRYYTGLGPIRLDVAAPVRGGTGKGLQIYLGIGQAF